MSIHDAGRFMKDIQSNADFRGELYAFKTSEEVVKYLEENGYSFNLYELEEVYTSSKVKCQFQEQADLLTEVYQMSQMILM